MPQLSIMPFSFNGLPSAFSLFAEERRVFREPASSIISSLVAACLPRVALERLSRTSEGLCLNRFDLFVGLHLPSTRAVGFTGLYAFKGRDEVWLARFGVREDQRGQGYGRALFAHARDVARKAGYRALRLWTTDRPETERARGMYERWGMARQEACAIAPPSETEGHAVALYAMDLSGGKVTPFCGSLEEATFGANPQRMREGRALYMRMKPDVVPEIV